MPVRNFNDGQEIVITDFNAITKALERGLYDRFFYELVQRVDNAFYGDSFLVSFASANSVTVNNGLGIQLDNTQTSPEPTRRPLYLASPQTLIIDAPDAANDRIDIVCVKAELVDELSGSRKVKDAISDTITNQNLVVQKDWSADVIIVAGTPDNSPVAPSTPAGYLKIAELEVTAVTGIAGSGAVSDERDVMPVGAQALLNTLGYDRLTAGAGVSLQQLMGEIDAFLKNGYFEYFDIDEINAPTAEPGSPAASKRRIFYRDNVLYIKNSSGVKVPVGSGGGGGGGISWTDGDAAPLKEVENGAEVYRFEAGGSQSLVCYYQVPDSYIAGTPLKLKIGIYSPASSGTALMKAAAGLVRQGTDAIDTPIATHNSTNTAITNTVAKQYRFIEIDLSTALGAIGAYAVSANDVIKIVLDRGTDTDTEDIRFIPTTTTIKSNL